jgi:hypothetical protein
MFNVSKTFQIITPESAKNGDFEKTGFVYQDQKMSLSEILKEIYNNGFSELSCSNIDHMENSKNKNHVWFDTIDPEQNRNYFEKMEMKYYSLHINCQERHFYKICKLADFIIKA